MALAELFSFVKSVIYIVLFLVALIVVYLYFNQNKMIYMPEGNDLI